MNERDREFDRNINQLIHLLKKIIGNMPTGPGPYPWMGPNKESGVHFNLCFFNFLPLTADELDELEDEYELFQEEKKGDDLKTQLSSADLEFLRRHGIRF